MNFRRMPIEIESPEQLGYASIRCNLAESSVSDAVLGGLDLPPLQELILGYGDHRGLPALREHIAADSLVLPEEILVTAGAAAALFIVHAALLSAGDHMIVVHPNYGTNYETPLALGCDISRFSLREEDAWRIDIDRLAGMMRPGTKLISITNPHNPTGVIIPDADLAAIAALAERKGCHLLVDETYRELRHNGVVPPPANLLGRHVISVSSLSKAFGMPGIRIGWVVSGDEALRELLLAVKEQIFLCNSVIDETVALEVLKQKSSLLNSVRAHVQHNRSITESWLDAHADQFRLVKPGGGVVCFPRIINEKVSIDRFYDQLQQQYATVVGPGHWFDMDRRYFRLGFGWPDAAQLQQGLQNIEQALADATNG